MNCARFAVIALVLLTVLAGETQGGISYAVGADRGTDPYVDGVYVVDVVASVASLLFATPETIWYGSTDGYSWEGFYANTREDLYWIDVVGHQAVPIGAFMSPGGEAVSVREIALNEVTGILYGTDYKYLYTIAPSTAVCSAVGPHGPGTANLNMWSMDYDPSIEQLVGVGHRLITPGTGDTPAVFAADTYYINQTTGAAALVAAAGQDRISDVWYDHEAGQMLGIGNWPGRLYVLDTTTGVATEIGTLPDMNLMGSAGTVPEPATLAFLGLGMIGLVAGRRRR